MVGGYAVTAAHGHPRYATGDSDVWVPVEIWTTPHIYCVHSVVQLVYPSLRIDLLMFVDVSRSTSATATDRTPVDAPVPFIGLDDLRRNKVARARSQDVADLDVLGS
ncbi:MAG: hypothetical protein ACR2GH_23035 [Pseudonocardia sp.]